MLFFLSLIWFALWTGSTGLAQEATLPLSHPIFEIPAARIVAKTHTLVFWVNGDADHFVPQSIQDYSSSWKRADAIEVERIKNAAQGCERCNVVLLHVQRGGSAWYKRDRYWATHLIAYEAGKEILNRTTPILNSADPRTLSELLSFSASLFPNTTLHLIYRGHPFIPEYRPHDKSSPITPFAYSFPESPYSLDHFVEGLKMARLSKKMGSIILASCRMAYFEVADALNNYAEHLIASQVDVLETIDTSFNLTFMAGPELPDDTLAFAQIAAGSLMTRFAQTNHLNEMMMESPVTRIHLSSWSDISSGWAKVKQRIEELNPDFFAANRGRIKHFAQVEKVVSERYLNFLRAQGKEENTIAQYLKFVKVLSPNSKDTDFDRLLEFLEKAPELQDILPEIAELRSKLKDTVVLFSSPPHSVKSGLSLQF